ncbi:unnamed protein product [Arabis nemorensis]|uniref:Phylloplanin n=1 Tax=Arabis nemorensis TaxID=586526 RepID=A0A565B986_9BRAS|nr:unnamed protein product [Arabis nemorensis]
MAMLKNKHITFSLILVCLIVLSPMANAQILSGLLSVLPVPGGGGLGIPNLVNVQAGVLFCTINGTSAGTSALPFANAGVQLQCGSQNIVVANTTTNSAGIIAFPSTVLQMLLPTFLSNCRLVVTTPLATCNPSLPLGSLVSPLAFVSNTVLNLVSVVPTGFNLTTN